MSEIFKTNLLSILKSDTRLLDKDGELMGNKIQDLADKTDEKLIELLLNNDITRDKFFLKVKEAFVFKTSDFKFYLDENKIDNSYTQYENRIGLTTGGKFLKDSNDVVLDFPYKDCILEGGQSSEEGIDTFFEWDEKDQHFIEKKSNRKEIFFNQILAKDEMDRLLEPKAFANIKKHSVSGDDIITSFERNEKGIISDNLIIKGNNLLALHSLKEEFSGKIKLIYIDPPYNTGSDAFKYNDNFNQSTWLTFMRNRLMIAKELLKEDGAIYVHIDHHQFGYLNILLNDVFGKENKVQVISIKTASPAGFKTVNPGPIDVTEYILFYTKNKSSYKFKKGYVPVGYNSNYNLFLERNPDIKKWKFIPIKEKVILDAGFNSEKDAKVKFGNLWSSISKVMIEDFAYKNSENVVSIRDPHKPTEKLKKLMLASKNEDNVIEYVREDNSIMYLYKGGALAFYSNKMQEIDGKNEVTELLTDFWSHISWAGIAKEGGVTLKNGKKPEKLLKQILELSTEENDIVLDYHLGSGTTASVAHKMKRQYIGLEQLNYSDNDSIIRLKNVVEGESSGVSKALKWKGGGSFVYLELAKNNLTAIEQIQSCNTYDELINFFDEMCEKYFLHYNVQVKKFKEEVSKENNFIKLSLEKQKEMFVKMLDLNQLYVNVSDMTDVRYKLSENDIAATKDFYRL